MTFTNIFSKWKESLGFFKKENLKLFVLVSLNNTKRSLGIFFSKFWWLLILILIVGGLIIFLGKDFITIFMMDNNIVAGLPISVMPISTPFILLGFSSLVLALIFFSFFIFIPYLIVRPSIEAKDVFYFKKHLKRIFGFLFLMSFMIFLSFLTYVAFGMKTVAPSITFKFFSGFLGIVFSLAVFFFLDSQKKLNSVFISTFKALKAFVYFLPVFIFLNIVTLFFNSLFSILLPLIMEFFIKGTVASVLFGALGGVLVVGFSFIVLFLNLSLVVNYYTMLKHKYYKLFYN